MSITGNAMKSSAQSRPIASNADSESTSIKSYTNQSTVGSRPTIDTSKVNAKLSALNTHLLPMAFFLSGILIMLTLLH